MLKDNTLWSPDTNIGFIGRHKYIELIDLSKPYPHVYSMHTDLKEAPIPLANFLIPLKECNCIDAFLNSLGTMFNFEEDEICLNEALNMAKLIMKSNGGKILLMVGGHDVAKIPQLVHNNSSSKDGMNKLMLRSSDYYQQLAQYLCIEGCISIDLYAIGNAYMVHQFK